MADDKDKTGAPDRSRISLTERYEVDYWKNKFGVSAEQLSEAVASVGNSPDDVEEYLKGQGNN